MFPTGFALRMKFEAPYSLNMGRGIGAHWRSTLQETVIGSLPFATVSPKSACAARLRVQHVRQG